MSRQDLPRRWAEALRSESESWVRQGLLNETQREHIIAGYPTEGHGRPERTIQLLTTLGSLLVGASVLLYLAANWPVIPAPATLAIIIGLMCTLYAFGFHHQFGRGNLPRLGAALTFLGTLVYGAAIWLIAQMFHFELHYSTGFLLWSLGVLCVALVTRTRRLLYLTLALLTTWIVSVRLGVDATPYLYPVIALAVILPLARRLKAPLAEAGILGGLFWWFALSVNSANMSFTSIDGHGYLIIPRLAILYGVPLWLAGRNGVGHTAVWMGMGALFGLGGMYGLIFPFEGSDPSHSLPSLLHGSPLTLAGVSVLLLMTVVGLILSQQQAPKTRDRPWPLLILIAAALAAHWPSEVVRLVLFNVLLFGAAIGVLLVAIQNQSRSLLGVGLFGFLLHLITLYFQLFFSALERSSFFLFGGVLLLGMGWLLERSRRRWSHWGERT